MLIEKSLYFFPFSVETSKCSDSCNNNSDPYAKLCVPAVIKNLNVKVFNLISRTNETRHIKWHETCKCKCGFNASDCNNKQRWNEYKYMCEYKELIDKGLCNKGCIWNTSNCECEYEKSCDIGEYLDYENCKCTKKIVEKLNKECTENIEEIKLVEKTLGRNENRDKYRYCTPYIVLFWIFFMFSVINIRTGIYFTYYKYASHNKKNLENDGTYKRDNLKK